MELKIPSIFSYMSSPTPEFSPSYLDDVSPKELGNILRRIMKERKITGEQICRHTGMSSSSISRILNGVTRPQVRTLNKIGTFLKVTPDEEAEILHAYLGGYLPNVRAVSQQSGTTRMPGASQSAESIWAEKAQIVATMEERAVHADFRKQVEKELKGHEYERDFVQNGVLTDFMVTFPDGFRLAIESKADIHRKLSHTYGFTEMILGQLGPNLVYIVIPFESQIQRPADMPTQLEVIPLSRLHKQLAALSKDHAK